MDHKPIFLADQVFERLETEILSGKYARGEVITEMKLAEDLGVSRTPVREAIRRLEQEHVLESSSRGITILGVTEEDLCDIYTIRIRIEGLAAAKAAERVTEETIAPLREALELQSFYVDRKDPEHIKYMDSMFHEALYRLSGSMIFLDTLLPLHKKVQKFRRASVQSESRAEASLAEHRRIYEAILAHDPDAAAKAMTEHVENAMKHIYRKEN